jgi:predicted outer membrane protein
MRRQHSRFVTAAIGGFAAVQLAGAGAAVDGRRGGADGTQLLTVAVKAAGPMTTESGFAQTKWGPLSAADRDLLVKVRQAGLWEIPVGREAAERAVRAKTREMLGGMAEQHVVLDRDVRRVAERLRVPLPDQPSEAQQGFLAEISGKSGLDYDRTAVKRLRQAHGGVFPVIAQVRATTRNTLMRDFAERAATFVNRHMDMLEATGLVSADALPEAPEARSAPDVIARGQRLPRVPSVADLPTPDGTGPGSESEPLPSTGQGLVDAPGGPLSPADRDLLVKVRQAGLWESPVGVRAAKQAARARTRMHLRNIGRQHIALDADVRRVAARLRVPLPDKPTRQQLGFIAEIFGKRGQAFDRTAVKRLRLAHGGVFPVIAQVRATTQNQHIRDFAERAAAFVNGHMDMLEATGLVTEDALPPVPEVQSAPDVIPAGQDAPSAPPAANVIGVFPSEFGPLSAADRDLLVKVRQAGLWEIPVGREAARRAALAKTREMLGELARQHEELDADVTSVAARLRVPLPDEPSAQQQEFIKEIFGKRGEAFDRTAVKRLRLAHGGVFPAIAQVRATTRNTLVRDFAERAAAFVNGHMDMLEATGLVDASAIPPAPVVNSAPAPVPSGSPAPSAPPATSVISTND